jgi:phosphoglycolate phosphatase-like HAD superfamily hydrolase
MSTNTDIRRVRHFIWDFDGTLFDTYPIIINHVQTALGEFGHSIDSLELMEHLLVLDRAVTEEHSKEDIIELMKSLVPTYRDPHEVNDMVGAET